MAKLQDSPYFCFSDVHAPDQHKKRFRAAYDLMKHIGCKGLIWNGDFLDMPELSRHHKGAVAKVEGMRIKRSFDAGNELLDETEKHAGKGKRYFVAGNHDARPALWMQEGANSVFLGDESLDVEKRLSLKERGYQTYMKYKGGPGKGGFFLGKLLITHGELTGDNPWEAHMKKYQTSVLFGHTHTVGMKHYSVYGGQRGSYNQGFMADESKHSMSYLSPPTRHIPGFALIYTYPGGFFNVDLIKFVSNRFSYGGYTFKAE